jgi:hypothetical protein
MHIDTKIEKGKNALIRLKALTAMAEGLLLATDLDNQVSVIDWMFENLATIGGIKIPNQLG